MRQKYVNKTLGFAVDWVERFCSLKIAEFAEAAEMQLGTWEAPFLPVELQGPSDSQCWCSGGLQLET